MRIFALMPDTDTYLSIGEVATALGVTVATVRNWERAGKLKSIRTPGGHRRFGASSVEALLAQEPWEPAS